MMVIDRKAGQAVQMGEYTLRVLAVNSGEVVVVLLGPGEEDPGDADLMWRVGQETDPGAAEKRD
jgi:hypothetical protein